MGYYDIDLDKQIECACGYHGPWDSEPFEEVLEFTCPRCDKRFGHVMYPSSEETSEAAARGSVEAIKELKYVEQREARWERLPHFELREPSQLLDVPGVDRFVVDWDVEEDATKEHWAVLRHDGAELGRELAVFEGSDRFWAVVELLVRRYGGRVRAVRLTHKAEVYVMGDRLSSMGIVDQANARLEASA